MADFLTFVDYSKGYIFELDAMYRISVCKAGYSVVNNSVQVLVEVKSNDGKKAFVLEEFDPKSEEFKEFLTTVYPIDCDGRILEVDLEDFDQLTGEGYMKIEEGKVKVAWERFMADITPHNALFLLYEEEI